MNRIERETNLRDYLVVIDKRKWTILLSMIVVVLLNIILIPQLPPFYKATATIIVEEPVTASLLLEGMFTSLPGSLMEAQKRLIKSQPLAEKVIQYLLTETASLLKIRGGSAEWLDSETAPITVQKSLSVSEVTGTNLLEISATVDTPKKAMDIANAAARICVAEGFRGMLGDIEVASEFIENQLQIFKKRLMDSEGALARYKAEKGFGALTTGLNKIDVLESQYVETKLKREIAEVQLRVLNEKLTKEQKDIVPVLTQTRSSLIAKLRETLVDLELKRALLLREFTMNHPDVIELQTEIDETVEALKEEIGKTIGSGGTALDPWSVYQERNKQISDLEVEIDSAKIREDSLVRLLNEYSSRMAEEAGQDAELLRLTQRDSTNQKTYSRLLAMKENLSIARSFNEGKVKIFRLATESEALIEHKVELRFVFSVLLGLVLGISLTFIQEHMDSSLKTIDEVERYLDKPVLGVIPIISPKEGRKKKKEFTKKEEERASIVESKVITHFKPKSPEAEAYRTLRTNIIHAGLPKAAKTLLITSSHPEEGKTITMVNLGITMADMGKRVLMVDADIRRPLLHSMFGQNKFPGLAEILQGRVEWDKVLQPSSKENLTIITSGNIPPNPAEIIASENMKIFLDEAKSCFDIVLMDCPCVLAVTDVLSLSPLVDGVLLVVRAEKTPREAARRSVVLLENVRSRIIGVVFNGVSTRRSYYYYYYRYKYRYGEGSRFSHKKLQNLFRRT